MTPSLEPIAVLLSHLGQHMTSRPSLLCQQALRDECQSCRRGRRLSTRTLTVNLTQHHAFWIVHPRWSHYTTVFSRAAVSNLLLANSELATTLDNFIFFMKVRSCP